MVSPDGNAAPVPEIVTNATPKLAYSVAEFCQATSLSRSLIYEEIRKGRLRATKIGTRTVILIDDGLSFLQSGR